MNAVLGLKELITNIYGSWGGGEGGGGGAVVVSRLLATFSSFEIQSVTITLTSPFRGYFHSEEGGEEGAPE